MALKIENTSDGKIIGIGEVTVLPGEVATVPEAYEHNPILEVYKRTGMAKITGKMTSSETTPEEKAIEKAVETATAEVSEEMTDEEAAKEANALGLNPAEAISQADVKKKVVKAKAQKG